ncbi:PREDICTED: probable sarcosine oxidase [Nelumbo nucifera]|uniref:Probable sarcosine oxidase n=1 Tax=Nelumbo nucifera TaxID=4432 RepID=A0A1U8BAV1_NELNU|nr:PREDICTED: probable sarcosine oxidase [Nelumbo nucifera]
MGDTRGQFDVIVVGAGIMGSCAAYQIAKRGRKVLLLDQFDFLHHRGSSHGESRTIRATYPEDYYPGMVIESSRLWEEAESEIGYRVYFKAPQFDFGPPDNKSLQAVIASCQTNSIPYRILDWKQASEHFSGKFELPENWIGLSTEMGGVIKPTKAVSMFQTLAIRRGAVLRDNMEVKEIKRDGERGCLRVCTGNGETFLGKKCVVTAGAWMKKLVKTVSGLVLPIQPLHTTVHYWRIKEGYESEFSIHGGFPSFASYGDPYIYGTPSLEFPGLIKIAVHGGYPCDPDKRTWAPTLIGDSVTQWIQRRFSGLVDSSGPVMSQSCMYSMTPDGDFVIDYLGGGEFGKDVVVAGGFSGHGFKMGPAVGRILADLALDGEALGVELSYLRLGRFEENPMGNVKEYEEQVSPRLNPH